MDAAGEGKETTARQQHRGPPPFFMACSAEQTHGCNGGCRVALGFGRGDANRLGLVEHGYCIEPLIKVSWGSKIPEGSEGIGNPLPVGVLVNERI
eukprot:5096937-Amphidinium_carterae.1